MAQRKIRLLFRQLLGLINFNVPSPVTLSDAEENASPSLYRKEMASKKCRDQSDDEDGEDDDGEEEGMDEEAAAPEPVKPHRSKIEGMYSEFINMARKFTSMVTDSRWKTRKDRS